MQYGIQERFVESNQVKNEMGNLKTKQEKCQTRSLKVTMKTKVQLRKGKRDGLCLQGVSIQSIRTF